MIENNNNLPLTTQQNKSPHSAIPIIHELACVYLALHDLIHEFPKLEKYSLGAYLEKVALDCIRQLFFATVMPPGQNKFQAIAQASAQFDTLKLFIRLALDISCIGEKQYVKLIPHLGTIGQMLGGWLKEARKTTGQPT